MVGGAEGKWLCGDIIGHRVARGKRAVAIEICLVRGPERVTALLHSPRINTFHGNAALP